MKFRKQVLGQLNKCYSLSQMPWGGKPCLLVAAEKHDPCLVFDLDGRLLDKVWDEPGGVMTMVPWPGRDGCFMATHRFYSPNDSADASLVAAEHTPDGWQVEKLCDLPFVHRFGILSRGGVDYMIACALKSGHEHKDDWRFPGKVFAGRICPDEKKLKLEEITGGLLRNHGFTLCDRGDYKAALVSCENGVFLYHPPEKEGEPWQIEYLLSEPASDAVLLDLDGDGEEELFTLSPFHGDRISIWKKRDGVFERVYDHPEKTPFLHAIEGGLVYGRPVVFCGYREGKKELRMFYWDEETSCFASDLVDSGAGPANCLLFERGGHPALLVSNRESDEIAIYDIEPNSDTKD